MTVILNGQNVIINFVDLYFHGSYRPSALGADAKGT